MGGGLVGSLLPAADGGAQAGGGGQTDSIRRSGARVDPFSYGLHEDRFEKLFHSYSFDTVMYFARRPEEDGSCADDLRELEQVLRLCAAHDVRRVVFFSSTSVFAGLDGVNEETRPAPITSAGVALTSCEELCAFYRMRHAIEILILRTPVTFGYGESASMVGGLIAQAVRHAAVRFKGGANQLCDFLSQEDLAELLMRMLDSWPEEHPVIHVPGAKAVTFGELGAAFIERFPTLRVSYAEHLGADRGAGGFGYSSAGLRLDSDTGGNG